MIDAAREMAKMFKSRDNKKYDAVAIGEVVSTNPLKVVDGDGMILDDELIITYNVQQLITSGVIKTGDSVCMNLTNDYSKYVVIDKVV